jgi:hypothetical protein
VKWLPYLEVLLPRGMLWEVRARNLQKTNKSTISKSATMKPIEESLAPPNAAVDEWRRLESQSSTELTTLQTQTRTPLLAQTTYARATELSTPVEPSPLPVSTPASKTSAKLTVTASPESDAEEDTSLSDQELLSYYHNKASSITPRKATENAETSMPTATVLDILPAGSGDEVPTVIGGTTSKQARPSVPAVTSPPSTSDVQIQKIGHQTDLRDLAVSNINS